MTTGSFGPWAVVFAVLLSVFFGLGCTEEDEPPPLSWSQLRNASYPSQVTPGTEVALVDGLLEAPEGTGTRPQALLADIGAFGELDGGATIDSTVFLVEWVDAETWTTSLAAVLNDGGEPDVRALAVLGSNLLVRALSIDDGQITTRVRSRDSADLAAGTIDELTRTYVLEGGALELREESSAKVAIESPAGFVHERTVLEAPAAGSTTIARTLAPRRSETFVLRGAAGQQLDLTVDSSFDSAIMSIQGVSDGMTLLSQRAYATAFTGQLPATQDYSIRLTSVAGADLDASMSYELTPAGDPSAAPPVPVPTPADPVDLALAVPRQTGNPTIAAQQPLAAVSTEAQSYIGTRDPARGIAVATEDERVIYAENGDEQLETASVIKVVVMTCVMHRAEQQGRLVDEWELSLMWPMITASDNDATDTLWTDLGGGPGVAACLQELGADGITPYNGPYWGTSTASATGMAVFMGRLVFGEIVNAVHRAVALELLTNVIDGQTWGVPAGAAQSGDEIVGVKDGWYPDDDGWRVNSVGFISPLSPGAPPYAIAVMTNYQSSMEYGIETIEGLAAPVYAALRAE